MLTTLIQTEKLDPGICSMRNGISVMYIVLVIGAGENKLLPRATPMFPTGG
jgi:hypothetical protein